MTEDQKAAYVHAQVACAMADLFGMLAANTERQQQGYAPAYDQDAFFNLKEEYCISHNDVLKLFHG